MQVNGKCENWEWFKIVAFDRMINNIQQVRFLVVS